MSFFPDEITVKLSPKGGAAVATDNIVVAATARRHGHDYFTDWIGLTDSEGVVHVRGAELQQKFQEGQQQYPMDYRVPLDDSDPVLVVRVIGGADFKKLRQQAKDQPYLNSYGRMIFERARNDEVRSAEAQVDLTGANRNHVVVELPVGPAQ